MNDTHLTERQIWLKYEYINKRKQLDHLIATRNGLNIKIKELTEEIT